jgi:hypothetical protein
VIDYRLWLRDLGREARTGSGRGSHLAEGWCGHG